MKTITPQLRTALAASYAILVLLPCLLIAFLPQSAGQGTLLTYAFAMFPTYYLDHWLFGGIGFHSPVIFVVFGLCVAAMLWPLPLLSALPTAWRSPQWRQAILGYAAAFLVFVVLAAWQMTHRGGLFFG